MARLLIPALLLVSITACGKKDAPASAGDAVADAAPAQKADVPDDSKSQAFSERLLKLNVNEFAPSDGGGAKFLYTSLSFKADNTWHAEGYVEADDERMDCKEDGTWTMEPAETETTAVVVWVVKKTTCISRETGDQTRALLTLSTTGEIDKIAFR